MSLFGSIGSFLGTAAKAVATGGISLVAKKIIPKPVNTVLDTIIKAQFPTSIKSAASTALAVATKNPTALFAAQGAQPMALNIGGILGGVSSIFGGNQNPVFQGISNVANLASNFIPQPVAYKPPAVGAPSSGSVATRPMTAISTVSRGFFNRYPNLATAIQSLRNQGRKVKRSQLYGLLKRFGPDLLITGGILSAAAVSELMVAGPGRRRMNPGNVSALRRSLRRLESFHHLCQRADKLRRPRARQKAPCR
jgi:hypothetical protein